jgi:hypothetical protein
MRQEAIGSFAASLRRINPPRQRRLGEKIAKEVSQRLPLHVGCGLTDDPSTNLNIVVFLTQREEWSKSVVVGRIETT